MAGKTVDFATINSVTEVQELRQFSRFIREEHLRDFTRFQLKLSRELDLPLMRFLSHLSEEELENLAVKGAEELLTAFEEAKTDQFIAESIRRWTEDQLPLIQKHNVSSADLSLVPHIRRLAFINFMPLYTQNAEKMVKMMKELEDFLIKSQTATLDTYIEIMQAENREHLHFVQKIANTSPGLIYVYDVLNSEQVFISNKNESFGGFNYDELSKLGNLLSTELIHEDDLQAVLEHNAQMPGTQDGETRTVEFRMLNKASQYRWMRAYETVFKRKDDGTIWQVIGILLDIQEEKSTSETLIKRDEQLRETQRIAKLGSFEWDLTGNRNSLYSEETLRILELPEGGASSVEEFYQFIHPADRATVRAAINKAVETGGDGLYECEYRYEKNKPKVIWSKGYVSYEDAKPFRMKGFVMDVTERHALTQRLLRSEKLYKQAEAQTHTGNWVFNLKSGDLEWSDELYRIYGFEVGSPISREKAAALNHPDDKELIRQKLEDGLRTKQPVDFYYRIRPENSPEKIVRAIGQYMFDENGEPFKWFGTVQDVTKEKLLEKDLSDKKNFIQKIADAAPSLIAAYNINTGKYLFVSKALEKLLGYDPEIALENGIEFSIGIMHPDDLQPIMEANQQALDRANRGPVQDDEQVVEFRYRLRHINGEYRWFHTYGTVFSRNAEGHVEEVLNISVDITELEKAHAELQEKNTELSQSNANLEEFAYVASHDLKEPLRKITTFGDRLQSTQSDKLDETGRTYLSKIIDSANRMQIMVNDLLSVSLISSEKSFETADLNEVLKDVLRILEYKIEAKKASIHAEKLPSARVVVSQFRQLFQNILSNSLKFSKSNHHPIINISSKILSPAEVVNHRLEKASSYLEIQISDNGIGFDNQFAEKIFAIFQRLHNRSEYEGTGIGLAICKKIVEHHKGTIFARGTPAVGATFTIILPL